MSQTMRNFAPPSAADCVYSVPFAAGQVTGVGAAGKGLARGLRIAVSQWIPMRKPTKWENSTGTHLDEELDDLDCESPTPKPTARPITKIASKGPMMSQNFLGGIPNIVFFSSNFSTTVGASTPCCDMLVHPAGDMGFALCGWSYR